MSDSDWSLIERALGSWPVPDDEPRLEVLCSDALYALGRLREQAETVEVALANTRQKNDRLQGQLNKAEARAERAEKDVERLRVFEESWRKAFEPGTPTVAELEAERDRLREALYHYEEFAALVKRFTYGTATLSALSDALPALPPRMVPDRAALFNPTATTEEP